MMMSIGKMTRTLMMRASTMIRKISKSFISKHLSRVKSQCLKLPVILISCEFESFSEDPVTGSVQQVISLGSWETPDLAGLNL